MSTRNVKKKKQALVRMWRNWNTHTLLEEVKMMQPLWKKSLAAPHEVKHTINT